MFSFSFSYTLNKLLKVFTFKSCAAKMVSKALVENNQSHPCFASEIVFLTLRRIKLKKKWQNTLLIILLLLLLGFKINS